ncbi:MAG: hypothetical protein LC754_07395 [Acidobacteria bacterium]|nr:hypothetical protein [Acidobacteriota bacterium]
MPDLRAAGRIPRRRQQTAPVRQPRDLRDLIPAAGRVVTWLLMPVTIFLDEPPSAGTR